MFPYKKNKQLSNHWGFSLLLLALNTAAHAGIVIDYSSVSPSGNRSGNMPGIVFYPGHVQTETGYQIQRSHAWRLNHQANRRTGAMLVYPPMAGSQRQQDVRTHLSRAHAYRLDYYKR